MEKEKKKTEKILKVIFIHTKLGKILYLCTMFASYLKKIGTIVLSLLLILTLGGMNVFVHHCTVENKSYFGIFKPASCPDEMLHKCEKCQGNCETHPTHSTNKDGEKSMSEHDCCSNIHLYLRIANPFVTVGKSISGVLKIIFQPVITAYTISGFEQLLEIPQFYIKTEPPPIPGSFLVVLYNSLKIPAFLS